MPLLGVNYDFSRTDTQSLNDAKRRINKIGMNQYQSSQNIQSTVRPTKSKMKENFISVDKFLRKMYDVIMLIPHSVAPGGMPFYEETAQKISTDYTPLVSEFSQQVQYNIVPVYNYFDPQQNELIKQRVVKLSELCNSILQNMDPSELIVQFIESISQAVEPLITSITNYSPLSMTLIPSQGSMQSEIQAQQTDLSGGYISGGSIIRKRFL